MLNWNWVIPTSFIKKSVSALPLENESAIWLAMQEETGLGVWDEHTCCLYQAAGQRNRE